jgi:hypothetical protein
MPVRFNVNEFRNRMATKQEEQRRKNELTKAQYFQNEMVRISRLSNENQKTELKILYNKMNAEKAEKNAKRLAAEKRSRNMLYGPEGKVKYEPVIIQNTPRSTLKKTNNYLGSWRHWKNTLLPKNGEKAFRNGGNRTRRRHKK